MRSRSRLLALLVFAALSLLSPRRARANMARSYFEGERFGPLLARTTTTVRVDRETLLFDVAEGLAQAKVTAVYQMSNAGAAASSTDVAFAFVRGDRRGEVARTVTAKVTVDGVPLAFRVVSDSEVLEPPIEAWSTLEPRRLGWLLFHLDFAPGQRRAVRVEYDHVPTEDRSARVNDTFVYEYLLSPAKSWAGFGPLEIEVRVPSSTRLWSESPFKREGEVHRALLPGLPEGELRFEVMSLRGLWFGMTDPSSYWSILLFFMASVTLSIGVKAGRRWATRRSRWRRIFLHLVGTGGLVVVATGIVAAVAVTLFPTRALGYGYEGFFGIVVAVMVAAPLGSVTGLIAGVLPARRTGPFADRPPA